MKHLTAHPRSRGFSLIELMLVIGLLAACAVVSNELFMSCLVIQRDAKQASLGLIHADGAVRMIRADVWGAESIHCDNPHRVTLRMPDGTEVRWELQLKQSEDEIQSLIYRSETSHGEQTPGDPMFAPADLTFRVEDSDLYLTAGSDSVRLTRIYSLLGEGGR